MDKKDEDCADSEVNTIELGGINFAVGNRFNYRLYDSIADWSAFLEVYNKNIDNNLLFDEAVRVLGVREVNESMREALLPLVETVYYLPDHAHVSGVMKQYMLYEPISIAVYNLFMILKAHFEDVVAWYAAARNEFIEVNHIDAAVMNWPILVEYWENLNVQNNHSSSSPILFYLNPPKDEVIARGDLVQYGFGAPLMEQKNNASNHTEHVGDSSSSGSSASLLLGTKTGGNNKPNRDKRVDLALRELYKAVKQFHYAGFCPKVPYQRLSALLIFPLDKFIAAIKLLKPDRTLPNYNEMEKKVAEILSTHKEENPIKMLEKRTHTDSERAKLPKAQIEENAINPGDAELEKIKWYVNRIMDLRKELSPYCNKIEQYYIRQAGVIKEVYEYLQKELQAFI
jgi:hypothetical protein